MDKEEVDKIKRAIHLIHREDKYFEGMNILARLVGIPEADLSPTGYVNHLNACKKVCEIYTTTKDQPKPLTSPGRAKVRAMTFKEFWKANRDRSV